MTSLTEIATAKLDELERKSLRRRLAQTRRAGATIVERDGRPLLSFSCNDYLNLSQHPRVKAAAISAIDQYGVGAGASRLVTGNHPLYAELEERLAKLKGAEAACVFGSGYLTNSGVIPALTGEPDLILVDELAHSCIHAGARASRARVITFAHNSLAAVEEILTAQRIKHRHAMIATDGVFSMDGDLAPLPALGEAAARHDAWLLTDDAHGLGVLADGRGSTFAHGKSANVPLQMGTLSKAIGGYGGYICADRAVIDLIKNRARTLVYSTALPPAMVAAAIAAIDVIEGEPALTRAPLDKAKAFTRLASLPEATSPIVPVIVGDAQAALDASRLLADEGFLVVAIRPPTVPEGTARLRLAFSAAHPDDEIMRLADVVRSRILTR